MFAGTFAKLSALNPVCSFQGNRRGAELRRGRGGRRGLGLEDVVIAGADHPQGDNLSCSPLRSQRPLRLCGCLGFFPTPTVGSVRALAEHDHAHRSRENHQINPHRPVADVVAIKRYAFSVGRVIAARHLP